MSNIFFTSDTHFGHNREFIYKARGFESEDEMTSAIMERWNKVVSPEDIVYFLGDVALGKNDERILAIIRALNGTKYLALGNHDTDYREQLYKETGVFADVQMGYRFKYKKKFFILSHYPQLVTNKEDPTPVFSLYGHTHHKERFEGVFHGYNVGVDAHNCTPVSLEELLQDLRDQSR